LRHRHRADERAGLCNAGQAYVNPRAWGSTGAVETAFWALGFLLVEDKFRNLFAMMFGAGVAILLAHPHPHLIAAHCARMAALFAIAFAHATLLANSDILRLYALAGLLLPLFLGLRPRLLLLVAAALVAAQLAFAGYHAWGWLDYWWRWRGGAVPFEPLARAEWAFGADPDALAAARLAGWTMLASLPVLIVLAASAIASGVAAAVPAANALVWSASLCSGAWR
jgi:uncharacterized protein